MKDIFDEARDTINKARQDSYGNPENSFQIVADFWTTYINAKQNSTIKLTDIDVAILMSLFKHARMVGQKYTRDNVLDAIGYLGIIDTKLLPNQKNKVPDHISDEEKFYKDGGTREDHIYSYKRYFPYNYKEY